MAETAQLTVQLDLKGNLTSGITKAQRQLDGLGRSAGRVGKGVGQVGAGFARAGLLVGGAAVAGLGAAAKAAIDFEDAFAGVRKTVDEADLTRAGLSFDKLARQFRDMATEIPIAATEFARLGETAGALGVNVKDIDDFVRITALLGVTTDLTADQAADSLGRIGTILKFTGQDYEDFADSLVALGNAGASTESEIIEITKRFASEGKAAGLATEQIAGLASATASLGFAPERGGTALARVFANMGTNISLANKKGKAFAKATGRSIIDLQKAIDRGEGLTIFTDFLKGLKGLSPTAANRLLKAAGITNVSDRTIFRAMADNLPFVVEQLGIAEKATGALSTEATKRFDTVASKLQLLRNNLIEAGITLGEGFAPAIGRAAEKLSAFLKVDANKSQLKALGEDIGAAIDDIDWQKVLDGAREFSGVLRSTLSITLDILSAINKLPTEVKAAAAALLVLNKASGGLIGAGVGNIAGGVAETVVRASGSRLPVVGKLFAQPVFVTNWPVGGLGGGVPAAAKGGGGASGIVKGVAGVTIVGLGAGAAAALAGVTRESDNRIVNSQGNIVRTVTDVGQRIALVRSSIAQLEQRAASGDALASRQLAEQRAVLTQLLGAAGQTTAASIEAGLMAKNAGMRTKEQVASSAMIEQALLGAQMATTRVTAYATQGAVRGVAPPIVSAIRSIPRPQTFVTVNVTATHVTKQTTIQTRYGPGGGSASQNIRGGAS